jgi:catechol 2,3-dioxygenase-like lactoylglutathione lyase family enzyme
MIDHTGVNCSDIKKSKAFYLTALAPLGYEVIKEFSKEQTGGTAVVGFGAQGKADFWLGEGTPQKPHVHIAFRAPNHNAVDAFFKAAISAGGKDNGGPGPRPHYHADYYGAFVIDPDGHNIEAVCHDSLSESNELVQFGP